MKTLLLFTCIVFAFSISWSQDSIQLKRSSWAGGVCCNSGDNFYIKIPKSLVRKGFDSLWVYIPGARIHLSSKLFSQENPNQATFGWAIYTEDESYNANREKSYHGIVNTDVIATSDWAKCQRVTVFLSNGKTKQIPVSYSGESLAYP